MTEQLKLTFTAADGPRVTVDAEFDQGWAQESDRFRSKAGRVGSEQIFIRYAVGGKPAEDALENAIRVGLRLRRHYGEAEHPPELSRLVGYNVDCEIPFILVTEEGDLLAELRAPFLPDDNRAFARSLARGLRQLERVGIVHRMINPGTLRWNGGARRVQLTRFDYAVAAGSPRTALQQKWASPEQRRGGGTADSRDDIWSFACAVLSRTPRGFAPEIDGIPDLTGSWLQPILEGVFEPTERRPNAAEMLLGRLGRQDTQAPRAGGGSELSSHALAEFKRICESKGRLPRPRTSPQPPAPPPRKRRRAGRTWAQGPEESQQPETARQAAPEARTPTAPPKTWTFGQPRKVRCVTCLHLIDWDGVTIFQAKAYGQFQQANLKGVTDPVQQNLMLQGAYIGCPNVNPGGRNNRPHFFPIEFAMHEDPKIVGLIGRSDTGKSCLLAAMAGEINRDGLRRYGLSHEAANIADHQQFLDERVAPFFDERKPPGHTEVLDFVEYADAILIHNRRTGHTYPLVFFDVSGESLKGNRESQQAIRFLNAVNGLIFVADPQFFGGLGAAGQQRTARHANDDPTFAVTVASLRWARRTGQARLPIPAAIVVAKSDLMRFTPPVDRWLPREGPTDGIVDGTLAFQETRDAYAFLRGHDATSWLAPYDEFERCTLHFVSATGVDIDPDTKLFARDIRPRRVLEPLAAILAMLGVIDGGSIRDEVGF